jgi:hypothetical protein
LHTVGFRYDPFSLVEFEAHTELLVGVLRAADKLQADSVLTVRAPPCQFPPTVVSLVQPPVGFFALFLLMMYITRHASTSALA